MAEGVKVCVGAGDCLCCVPRGLEQIIFPWDGGCKKKLTKDSRMHSYRMDQIKCLSVVSLAQCQDEV